MNEAIEDGLGEQMDIVEMIKWFRVFKLISIMTLRKNQTQLVKYFQEYSLKADSGSKLESSIVEVDLELEDLMRGFNPAEDKIDQVMLYMLTGRNNHNSGAMKDWVDDGKQPLNDD